MDKVNILVVGDKKKDSLFLEETLAGIGFKVWVIDSPDEALRLIKDVSFVVVICDLHLSGMSGIDMTKAILRIRPGISVLIVTDCSFIPSAVEAMEAGAYEYIIHPFNPGEVKIVTKRAVERFYLISSDRKKEQFAELSAKDGLTGVYNRRFLNVYVNNKISTMKRMAEKFSLLMADLDYFKRYNDTKGHVAGDELLRKVCDVFVESVRQQGDMIFRYGGEEFVIFLERTDKKGAFLVAERIRTLVNLYAPITVSIGISTSPDDGANLDELLVKADSALYKAKETGRDRVCMA
ncbi:MAG: diguanylate cyclase [Candidatus Omnitrophota bacterium]